MPINIKLITLEEFLKIRKKLYDNSEELYKEEHGHHHNLVTRLEWQYQNFDEVYIEGEESLDFQSCYHFQTTMRRWNHSAYGKSYQSNLDRHKKVSEDPASLEILKKMVEHCTYAWSKVWRNTKKAIEEDKFLSFWKFHVAYNDTKGSWRHWWDALNNDKKFKAGDIVELRANSRRRHTLEIVGSAAFLRRLSGIDFISISKRAMIVIAYDQQSPDTTYSYKKSQGSCRLVSILPMGSTKIIYVPEQFLKISRKKTIKEARAKK